MVCHAVGAKRGSGDDHGASLKEPHSKLCHLFCHTSMFKGEWLLLVTLGHWDDEGDEVHSAGPPITLACSGLREEG